MSASKFTAPAKPAAKKTVVKPQRITPTTKIEVEQPTRVEPTDDEVFSAWQQINDAVNNMWARIKRPSWVRQLVNLTIGLVAYAATWYGCMTLLDMLMLGVISYTGIGFISFIIAFLGVIMSFMAAFKVGKLAYDAAAAFSYEGVKSRVSGWFTFRKPAAA